MWFWSQWHWVISRKLPEDTALNQASPPHQHFADPIQILTVQPRRGNILLVLLLTPQHCKNLAEKNLKAHPSEHCTHLWKRIRSAGKSSHRHLRTWVTVIIQHSLYHTCTDRRRTVACAVQRRKESQWGGERRIWGLLTCCLHILHGCWRQDGSRSALRNRLERERAEEDRWGVQGGWQVSGKAGWREGRCEERGRWMNRGGKRVTGGCCIPSLRTEPHKASRAECCTHPAPAPLSLWVQLPDCCHKKDAASVSGIRQGNLCVCVCVCAALFSYKMKCQQNREIRGPMLYILTSTRRMVDTLSSGLRLDCWLGLIRIKFKASLKKKSGFSLYQWFSTPTSPILPPKTTD